MTIYYAQLSNAFSIMLSALSLKYFIDSSLFILKFIMSETDHS